MKTRGAKSLPRLVNPSITVGFVHQRQRFSIELQAIPANLTPHFPAKNHNKRYITVFIQMKGCLFLLTTQETVHTKAPQSLD